MNLEKESNAWAPVVRHTPSKKGYDAVEIIDWQGGTGEKPKTGQYIGAHGLVENIDDAIHVRRISFNSGAYPFQEKKFWLSIVHKDNCFFSRREGIVGKIIFGHSIRLRLFGKDII